MDSQRRPPLDPREELIHGHGIELAERTQFTEHDTQPGLEVATHSTLEVAPGQGKAPFGSPVTGFEDLKTWEKAGNLPSLGYGGEFTIANSPPPPPITAYGFGSPPPMTGMEAAPPGMHRPSRPGTAYSSTTALRGHHGGQGSDDFGNVFERPLVPPLPGEGLEASRKREFICGVRRQTFWIILAVGIFLAMVAIATGVGVGVSLGNKSSNESPPPTSSQSASSSTPVRTLPVHLFNASTVTDPTVTNSSELIPAAIDCPSQNLTLYSSPATPSINRKFLLLCGRDYNVVNGATDMFAVGVDTMAECIDSCAKQDGCVGAGWGEQSGRSVCYLKSRLGQPNMASHWQFAVEDTEVNGGGKLPVAGS
ncbi:hypothetical protein QBC40DRAFT_70904 [Triangularia verruculosa]|uniref:Apple domain-containing protein n=1 Tax=Triangularia verruculosa TaxID=2587418 RepID=A0AAN6XMG9_9PEZI|nr:hypothetical protein QBC40DRAFT_70904 [Triangularia verruculosa]